MLFKVFFGCCCLEPVVLWGENVQVILYTIMLRVFVSFDPFVINSKDKCKTSYFICLCT